MPKAPYIPFAILLVARISGTPESRTAVGNALPDREAPSLIEFEEPFTYRVIAETCTSQKIFPPP